MWTDNQANAEAIYNGYYRQPEINNIIAQIYQAQIQGCFSVKFEYIPGRANSQADLLSRNRHREFLKHNPTARYLHLIIPSEYSDLI
ncbi:24773_t:CDS:1, partial [Dentiscutata erythropus]